MAIVTRTVKGSPLTWAEGDNNFLELEAEAAAAQTTADNHIADANAAHAASAISIADVGGYFTATDVEGALQEVAVGSVGAAGSNGEIQYNNSAAFGASANLAFTTNTYHSVVAIAPNTVLTALSTSVYSYGQVAFGASILGGGGTNATLYSNCYYDASDVLRRKKASSAGYVQFGGAEWSWQAADSGAAGDDLTASMYTVMNVGTSSGSHYATFYGRVEIRGASIVQNSQSAAYTLIASDANKHILHPSADTTARIFTIPANSSVPFEIGTAVTFVNQNSAGVITIAITTDTMRLAGAGTTGSRTLAANGIATALKITATEWIISGTGLT